MATRPTAEWRTNRGNPAETANDQGSAETFACDVWVDMIAQGEPPSRLRVGVVRFAPGAHTAWHRHANGQTLHILDGRRLVQSRGGQVLQAGPGDTIITPPGEWHWHGAAPSHFMTHLAMSEDLADGQPGPVTEWGDHLTGDEYPRPITPSRTRKEKPCQTART
ncbi:MAG: cupin domain-containing protein [Propionibacteriaceae bacterium]